MSRVWPARRVRAPAIAALLVLTVACGPAATPVADTFSWQRIDPIPDEGVGPYRIIGAGDDLLGFGATVWVSTDGVAWSPVAFWAASASGAAPSAVAAAPQGIIAVGMTDGRPTAWLSPDAVAWEAVDAPELGPPTGFPSGEPELLVAGPAGIVAAGTGWGADRQDTLTWFSEDGRTWSQNDPLPGEGARAVVATPDGFVLAEAAARQPGEFSRTAFWTSPDGRSWTAAEGHPSFANAEPQDLVAGPTGLVAVGYRAVANGLAPMAWTSPDGRSWEPADETPAMAWWGVPGPTPALNEGAIQGTSMTSVAAVGAGFLAVGSRWGLDPGASPDASGQRPLAVHGTLWWSDDGRRWELLPDAGFGTWRSTSGTLDAGLMRVTVVGDVVLICGTTPELGATIWRAVTPG